MKVNSTVASVAPSPDVQRPYHPTAPVSTAKSSALSVCALLLSLFGALGAVQRAYAQCPLPACDPLRINLGGAALLADGAGRVFSADPGLGIPVVAFPNGNPIANTNTGGGTGTSAEALYQTGVYSSGSTHMFLPAYTGTTYTVVLHFAENSFSAANQRVFDISIQGIKVENDFDIYAAAGAANTAVAKSYTATATNGYIDILFIAEINVWTLCGVELIPASCAGLNQTIALKPTVSGCYQNGGVSKTTVNVEVSWTNAIVNPAANDASDGITVTLGSQTKTINPGYFTSTAVTGRIVSPQMLAFEVDADGSALFATATFANNPSCTETSATFNVPTPCPPTACTAGQTGGIVFEDFNADGVKDAGEVIGLSGVLVQAYNSSGALVATATSNYLGQYYFTGLAPGDYPLRIEFSNIPSVYYQGSLNGPNGRTTTQFASAPSCNVNLGVLNPQNFTQTNPPIVVPCYSVGDPLGAGSIFANTDALVMTDYFANGFAGTFPVTHLATSGEVGTLWGVAYNKSTKRLFTSAFLRRHSGLGPEGLGGLYIVDPFAASAPYVIASLDVVADLGINVGTISDNPTRGLSPTSTISDDIEAFAKVGKVGIGDIDLSDDGNTLFMANLFDQRIYTVDLTNYNTTQALPNSSNVGILTFPNPGCNSGTARPFGLKVFQNKLYVGVVCDASASGNRSDLRAFIYAYDLGTNSWDPQPVFDFPLTYPKGDVFAGTGYDCGFSPWTDDFQSMGNSGYTMLYPQPFLSDIEFDVDGSMVLGFMDRTAAQFGYPNNIPVAGTTIQISAPTGGDILRASKLGGNAYVLENAAKSGPSIGYSPINNQGPGFGEFYNDDLIYNGSLGHSEISIGSLALRPGSGEVLATAMDPVDGNGGDVIFAGGIRTWSNTSGLTTRSFQLFNANTAPYTFLGKAVSLGDIELLSSLPNFMQIGNYVWNDTDKDGTQDPNEAPISGINVSLYDAATNTLLAVTTTGANGEYYFTQTGTPNETWIANTGVNSAIQPNTAYNIVFGYNGQTATGQYSTLTTQLIVNGRTYYNTVANSGEGSNPDYNDNDAAPTTVIGQPYSGYPIIQLTTAGLNTVNHTFDAGFWFCPEINNPSPEQRFCQGSAGNDITVQTNTNAIGSIRFVRFTSDQMASTTPSPAEALTIYSGSTLDAAVTPTGAGIPYTATLSTSAAGWSSLAPDTYYVYAILNPDQVDVDCRPVQEIIVNVIALPVITTIPGNICLGATVNLATLVTGNTPPGALTYYTSLASANAFSNPLANTTVAPGATTTYYVRSQTTSVCYSIAPIAVNVNTAPDFSVANGSVCKGGSIDLATLVNNTGGGTLSYHTTLSAAQSGAPALASSTVSPASATNYYVRSVNSSGCFTVKEITVTIKPIACGATQVNGPN